MYGGIPCMMPLYDAIRALHACGWRVFEMSTEHLVGIETDHDPDSLIEKTQDCMHGLGVSAPQAHAYINANVANPDVQERERDIKRLLCHIDIASRLGARHVVVHPGGKRGVTQTEQESIQKLNVEAFRRLGDFAGELGVCVAIENLTCPGATTPAELLELLTLIDHSAIGVNLDTSHANMSGLNVAQVIRELGSHLAATHISDNDGSQDQHLTPGNGIIDWPAAMDAFREIDYKGTFNLEIAGDRHAVLALRQLKTRYALAVTQWLVALTDSKKE